MSTEHMNLKNVTLVAVSGIDPVRAARALELSMPGIDYHDIVLISHEKPTNLHPKINFKACKPDELASTDPKNTDDYSYFMAYQLAEYIESDFALIVHHNAHVIHPESWNPLFLEYDYIGAPWRPKRHYTEDGREIRVGNGGFSLRSKRLLGILNELALPFTDKESGFLHEDGIICVHYRKELEEAGIRFAPVAVAARFSHEFDVPESLPNPFGYHDFKTTSRWHRLLKLRKIIRRLLR